MLITHPYAPIYTPIHTGDWSSRWDADVDL